MSNEIKNFSHAELQASPASARISGLRTQDARLKTQASGVSAQKMAEEFAAVLLMEMLKSMRATLSGEGLDGDKSSARDTYTALADTEVTRALAKRDGMGITQFLAQSLTRMGTMVGAQETSSDSGEKEKS